MASPKQSPLQFLEETASSLGWQVRFTPHPERTWKIGSIKFSDGFKEIIYPLHINHRMDHEEAAEILKFIELEFKRMWKEGALRGVKS